MLTCSYMMGDKRRVEQPRSLCKLSVWQANVRCHTANVAHPQSLCKLSVWQASVYTFGCHTACSSVAQPRSLCKLSVWQANVRVPLSHRLFERRTATIVMQTVGLASERTRSAVTPPVRASHSHDRCANCRFAKRTYAFACAQLVW